MAEFELPAVPASIVTILGILTPYLVALVNQPRWSATQKRVIGAVGSFAVSGAAIAIYYGVSGEPVTNWWSMLLLGLLVSQTAYALVAKPSAKTLEVASSKSAEAAEPEGDHRAP